jgi:hypothetical protein
VSVRRRPCSLRPCWKRGNDRCYEHGRCRTYQRGDAQSFHCILSRAHGVLTVRECPMHGDAKLITIDLRWTVLAKSYQLAALDWT